jgi:hypothetical protein
MSSLLATGRPYGTAGGLRIYCFYKYIVPNGTDKKKRVYYRWGLIPSGIKYL